NQPGRAAHFQIKAADRQARLGEVASAVQSYQAAIEQLGELEAGPAQRTRMARVMTQLARLLRGQGKIKDAQELLGAAEEAAEAFRAASAIRMRIGDRFGLIPALLNLGIIQEQMGEISPALGNYYRALDLARQTGYVQGEAVLEVNLSNLERRAGLVTSALE